MIELKNKEISYFTNGIKDTTPQEDTITIEDMIISMTDKNSEYKNTFKQLREGNEKVYKSVKSKLPYFTITGQFSYRSNANIIDNTYTWLCPIDIDYKENSQVNMNMVSNMLCSEDFVLFCAKSPSGKGLKAIIRLKENAYDIEKHREILKEIIYPKLEKDLGCVFDLNQAKLSQPFYFTYDEDAYINYDAIELDTDYTIKEKSKKYVGIDENSIIRDYLIDNKCDEILNLTDNKWSSIGNISYTIGGWYKSGYFSFSETEIKDRLKKAVDDNTNIINKKQKYKAIEDSFKNGSEKPISIKQETGDNILECINDEFEDTNTNDEIINDNIIADNIINKDNSKNKITSDIYDNLPKILQELTEDFVDEKKDIILLSTLVCLSYYFSNVKFDYFYKVHYNNFYVFIIAPSSSGKSIMNNSKKLLYDIDKFYRDKFREQYDAYKLLSKKDKEITPPPSEIVIIAGGDATRQGLYKYLQNNYGKLLIFDTEADSMMNQKGDYDYSTLLRKGFENESFSKLLSGAESLRVEDPKLNICVSGTKSQIQNIIGENGSENGTFNRFMFYNWETEPTIESPHKKIIKKNIFENYSKELYDFYMAYLFNDGIMNFEFTEEQEKLFDLELFNCHDKYLKKEDDSVSGIIKRHFLIGKKMCVTIAGLRLFDKYHIYINNSDLFTISNDLKIDFTNLRISDDDLNVVIKLIKIMLNHSLQLFRKFTPEEEDNIELGWKEELYNLLPSSFNRLKVMSFIKIIGKSERTLDRWLSKMKKDGDILYDVDKKLYFKDSKDFLDDENNNV